jgi:predicted P-loop ATPase
LIKPGVKADMVLVMVGPEGTKKSTSVAAIAPTHEWFVEIGLGDSADDLARKIKGRCVVELAELRGLKSAAKEHIKAIITTPRDTWVPKYFESTTTYARRCLFVGTSNDYEFLDADGSRNRRWLPVAIRADAVVDVDAIARDRDQLWAEGAELFREYGVMWKGAERLARKVVGAFTAEDAWKPRIQEWLDLPAPKAIGLDNFGAGADVASELNGKCVREVDFSTTEALAAVGIQVSRITPKETHRMSALLRSMGFDNRTVTRRGKRGRWWSYGE